MIALGFALTRLAAPPEPPTPIPTRPGLIVAPQEQRARRLFIASGVISRVIAISFIASGESLRLSGAHLRGELDARAGVPAPASRRVASTLAGTGLGIYVASRLMRLGFYLHTRSDIRLGLPPVATLGLGLAGEF